MGLLMGLQRKSTRQGKFDGHSVRATEYARDDGRQLWEISIASINHYYWLDDGKFVVVHPEVLEGNATYEPTGEIGYLTEREKTAILKMVE